MPGAKSEPFPAAARAVRVYDADFMAAALTLARRGLGRTWPNPAVGCVLVDEAALGGPRILARGWTQPGGRPHAEAEALRRAGARARGATAYVTLEPCCFVGKSPACTEGLIAAGVARVIIAARDPDPRVAGGGVKALRAAGIEVLEGCRQTEAEALNRGQFLKVLEGRPAVTLKIASTLDARTATRSGDSKWITGPEARAFGHRLRADHDAILVGITTALVDNPSLTCRLPGLEDRSPVRIVADSRLRLPLTSALVETAREVPLWVLTAGGCDPARAKAFREAGVEVIDVPDSTAGRVNLKRALECLAQRGITRLLTEGGAQLGASLLAADLVDRLVWFRAPAVMGGEAYAAIAGLGIDKLADMKRFARVSVKTAGSDLIETYEPDRL